MIVINSGNIDTFINELLVRMPLMEGAAMVLGQRRMGNYIVALGTIGHLHVAFSGVLELLIEAKRLARDLALQNYSVIITHLGNAVVTPEELPEVVPILPPHVEVEHIGMPYTTVSLFGCNAPERGLVKMCIGDVEIGYALP